MKLTNNFFVQKPIKNIHYGFGFLLSLKNDYGFKFEVCNNNDLYMYVDIENKLIRTYNGEPMFPVYDISEKRSQYLSLLKAIKEKMI
jgi:hypothetical protein